MKIPTCSELYDKDLGEPAFREADDSWRHGSNITEVYYRHEEGTYWMATYQLQTDGEYHGLRQGDAEIVRCWPQQVTLTRYTTKEPA